MRARQLSKSFNVSSLLTILVAFKVFNASNDGYIKREEVLTLLKAMAGSHLSEQQITILLEQTVPRPLDYETFCAHFDSAFVQSKMTIKL